MNGRMKHIAMILLPAGVVAGFAAFILHGLGWIPFWVFAAVIVLAFPVAAIALFLRWMADEGEEDIPFIGY